MKSIEGLPQKRVQESINDKMRAFLAEIYTGQQEPQARLSAILERLGPFLTYKEDSGLDQSVIEEIKQNITQYTQLSDQEEFINSSMICLEPLFRWQENDPTSFEARLRESFVIKEGFIPLNEMLSYGYGKDYVHIHLAPSETLGVKEKFALLEDGFKKLAEILKSNPELKEVRATSWIVAANPELMEKKLGFNLKGEISPEEKNKYFRPEAEKNIPVHKAIIGRDDFINKYG